MNLSCCNIITFHFNTSSDICWCTQISAHERNLDN